MINSGLRAFSARLYAVVVGMCLLSGMPARADVLDISFGQPGYSSMVHDAKLRGDGIPDWNLGSGSGDSNRFYSNFLADNTTPSGRLNNFVQWFDVSGIPAGSIINSATLTVRLANRSANNRTFTNVKLSRLQPGKDWVEFVVGGSGPHTDGSVTWNHQAATTIPWATPGALGAADIDLGTTQVFNVVGVDGSATIITRDISAWVQAWVDTPANNEGMVWWAGGNADSNSANAFFWFGTKEDGAGPASESASAAPSLVIDYTPGGSPVAPIINEVTPDPDHNAFANVQYVKQLTLSQGTFPITWTVLAGSPPGTAVDGGGMVTGWTPTPANVGSTFTINIRAENAQGSDDESWQATVHAVTPVIAEVAPDPDKAVPGNEYMKQLALTQGTTPIVWSVIQGPPGTAVDSTGKVTGWTPGPADVGTTKTFEIKASNEAAYGATFGGNDTETWQVNVPPSNNGFVTDSVFVVRNPDNGGQVREFDKFTGDIITAEFLPDGSIWQSITFSGVGAANDARMFVARPNGARTDIEIAEIDYQAATVNSTTLSTIIDAPVGSNVAFGNIRYSNLSNTLFVSLNPNETTTSTGVCYEIPLSLAANSRIHTYLGETVPAVADPPFTTETRVTVAINRRDGTLYMVGQHLGDATGSGLGDVIAFTTAGRTVGGTTSSFAVIIDGQTCNAGNANYVQPSTVIYRQRGGEDDRLIIPTNLGTNTSVLEFYLNTTLHPVDGDGNLALRTDNGNPLTIGRGWNGQQDIETGDIWLGAKHFQFHVIRSDDAIASYEGTSRSWFDAAVPPAPSPCPNEPVADADADGDVDMDDFGEFQKCYTGQLITPLTLTGYCFCIDVDKDGDIDSTDFNHFVNCETGPSVPWVSSVGCPE